MTEETVEEKQAETQEENWKDKYLRSLAEMENLRKRLLKEKQEAHRLALENAILEFLGPLDNFENALRFAEGANEQVKSWALGFEMILSQFKEVLHNHGILTFHSEGNLFNPESHEAIEVDETNNYPDGTILQEFSKGYKSAARVIRPARVKVAKNITKEAKEEHYDTKKEENHRN